LFRSAGPTIFEGSQGTGWTWQGNIAFGGSLGPVAGNPGVSVVDPQLQFGADGLWRPGPASPAINGGAGDYSSLIAADMDGQARIGIYDVGADEVSAATIVRRPLSADDVGPAWTHVDSPTPPPGGGCKSTGCAIQAENFEAILDPDGDGNMFTTVNVAAALGESAIKAPNGSTVNLPGTHETVATYEMMFQTPGTYTAYYRVRGFSSSSDSIYAPDSFGANPDNSVTTNETGEFFWKKDTQTFSILAGHVGMPLEFRLGMREQQAEIDALVLDLSSSLTSTQLDDLFAFLPGDYNGDGLVDTMDYVVWRKTSGNEVSNWSGADGNGDGVVDAEDYDAWAENFGSSLGGAGAGAAAPVPESSSQLLALVALIGTCFRRKQFVRGGTVTHMEGHGGS
jgi:hypothetical protein